MRSCTTTSSQTSCGVLRVLVSRTGSLPITVAYKGSRSVIGVTSRTSAYSRRPEAGMAASSGSGSPFGPRMSALAFNGAATGAGWLSPRLFM